MYVFFHLIFSILVGLSSGQIVALDRNWFDPNRVSIVSDENKEEGLIPYSSKIIYQATDIVSHQYQIPFLENIVSGSTVFESTSIIFAYGLDLFCTKVTPGI